MTSFFTFRSVKHVLAGIVIFGLMTVGVTCVQPEQLQQQQSNQSAELNQPPVNENVPVEVNAPVVPAPTEEKKTKFFSTRELGEIDEHLSFSAQIPTSWEVEYVSEIDSINFFAPLAEGENNLDKSQIFVRYFTANQFLTLQTVTIHSQTELTLNGRPAVTYDIEKKTGVADFPSQPNWRNQRHLVTDIRSTDENPTVFYVFGQRPGLESNSVQAFLESISFEEQQLIYFPIQNFTAQATYKLFGTYITPATSPIQPERFSGYHTGVDVETTQDQQSQDVAIYAVADGTVSVKTTASGYGGVLAIEFESDGQTIQAMYGHVRLSSIAAQVGDQVKAGQQLGFLGTGFSDETDGERKHLHFGLVLGAEPALPGYVSSQSQLGGWLDPADFLIEYSATEP